MSGRSNGVGSFERVDDRICDHDWVGAGDPPRKLKFDECCVDDHFG